MYSRTARPARLLAATLAIATTGLATALPATAATEGSSDCGTVQPASASTSAVRQDLICLINVERARRGLPRVRYESSLTRTAGRHARDMVERRYFAHESPDGRSLRERIAPTEYARRARRTWRVGENLAWASLDRSAPVHVVAAWLRSPAHRRVMLDPDYRDIGVAVVRGAPVARGDVTYVLQLGIH